MEKIADKALSKMTSLDLQKQRLQDAKLRMMGTHIYFGGFAGRLQWHVSRKVPTAATNGIKIWFNPEFIAGITDRELYGLCIHEVGHPALGHDLRRKGRDPKMWNVAADAVLNALLKAESIPLPPGGIDLPQYKGMSAEDVYQDLMKNGDGGLESPDEVRDNPRLDPRNQGPKAPQPPTSSEESDEDQQDGPGGSGDEADDPNMDGEGTGPSNGMGSDEDDEDDDSAASGAAGDDDLEDEESIDTSDENSLGDEEPITDDAEHQQGQDEISSDPEAEWRVVSENLAAMAKRIGQMGGDMAMQVREAQASRLPWASYLAALIEDADSVEDVSWSRSNRRLSATGGSILFPGQKVDEPKDIVIVADTSGSMWDQKVMDAMAGEISGMLKARNFDRAIIMYVDHEVQHVDIIDPKHEEVEFEFRGGGGTAFAPPFVWLKEREDEYDPAALVYLTDLQGSFPSPDLKPDYPVFWVNYGGKYTEAYVPDHWKDTSEIIHADAYEM